jgi:hypothetical protein
LLGLLANELHAFLLLGEEGCGVAQLIPIEVTLVFEWYEASLDSRKRCRHTKFLFFSFLIPCIYSFVSTAPAGRRAKVKAAKAGPNKNLREQQKTRLQKEKKRITLQQVTFTFTFHPGYKTKKEFKVTTPRQKEERE